MVTDETLLKVYAWYDNEVGYACRMVDLANIVIESRSCVMAPACATTLIVTASYWGFTLIDGALRMLVLLHFFQLGYTPFTLAFLFLLYEAAGIAANLGGGWLATRFGIPRMLAVGQTLQIAGLAACSRRSIPPGARPLSVAWVVAAQGIAGVAKDITKTASKSAIKATSAEGAGQLFRWVAWFTGSKNAMKGVGFFVGGLLLQTRGLPACAVADGRRCSPSFSSPVCCCCRRELGKAKSSKIVPRAVRQIPRRQPAGGRAHLPVRRARCLVRRRPAGVPLRHRLALPRSRRVPRGLDHRATAACRRSRPRWCAAAPTA